MMNALHELDLLLTKAIAEDDAKEKSLQLNKAQALLRVTIDRLSDLTLAEADMLALLNMRSSYMPSLKDVISLWETRGKDGLTVLAALSKAGLVKLDVTKPGEPVQMTPTAVELLEYLPAALWRPVPELLEPQLQGY